MCVLVGGGVVVLGYWLALPLILPMWPGVVAVVAAAVIGAVWEYRAEAKL